MNTFWATCRYVGQFAILGLAAAFVVTLVGGRTAGGDTTSTPVTVVNPQPVPPESYADAVASASPAVVNVYADRLVRTRANPQVSRFTGRPLVQVMTRSEVGAGVVASSDGYVITNFHIVDGARSIMVGLYDGRLVPAQPVGTDLATDLAVLKIQADDLPLADIGNSQSLRMGDVVLAIGNPFGLGKTVTMGIVSATGRGDLNVSDYADLIQTDAAINRGSSGGALIDADGRLLGINTAMLDQQDAQGIGFAIPIETALDVMNQLIETGQVTRGWLGVRWDDGRRYQQARLQAQGMRGHMIADMLPGGPAAEAGLRPGDYVVRINETPVGRLRDLLQTEAGALPGTTITLDFWRDGQLRQTQALLIQRPPNLRSSG